MTYMEIRGRKTSYYPSRIRRGPVPAGWLLKPVESAWRIQIPIPFYEPGDREFVGQFDGPLGGIRSVRVFDPDTGFYIVRGPEEFKVEYAGKHVLVRVAA